MEMSAQVRETVRRGEREILFKNVPPKYLSRNCKSLDRVISDMSPEVT